MSFGSALFVSSRSFLHFAASKVSSPQPLDSAIQTQSLSDRSLTCSNEPTSTSLGTERCSVVFDLSILEVESTEETGLTPQTGAVFSRSSPEGGRLREEVVQQRTPPAVAVLGGIPAAAQNVAAPPQHVLQPVQAASLPSPLLDPASEMEQPKADVHAADQEQTTTVAQQNSNTKEPEKSSTLDFSTEAVQRQPIPLAAENCQNLSDRLSACDAGNVRKEQELHYGCNVEKTSFEHSEKEMADGTVKMEKEPLAPEKAYLECQSKTGNKDEHGTKHTARQSTDISTIESSSAVSTACKATDRDHKQPGDREQFQTVPSLLSGQSSLLLESDVQQLVQQPHTATVTANAEILESSNASISVDEFTKESPTANEEGTVHSPASEKEQNSSDTGGFSSKQEESASRLPGLTGNGNGTPNNTDDDDGCFSKSLQHSSIVADSISNAAFLQKSSSPSNLPQNAHITQANQLSPDSVNCSENPKSVLTGNKTSTSGGQEIRTVSLDGTGVCYDISVKEPKVLGDETCTHNIQALKVTEGSHVVACCASHGITKKNDCAKSMQMSPYQDHQPDGSYIFLDKSKTTNSGGLDSNEPCLSQVKHDCLIQQGQESILVDHKLTQIECLNDGISTSDNMNVDEKHDEGSEDFSGINAVEMKELIDVGILVQPGMEETWLVVSDHSSLIDGQCQSTENAEMIDVSTEAMGLCPESQTSVAVYECTVPCFPPDAIHEAAKLLLPEKGVEVPADKHSLEPLTEALTADLPSTILDSQNVFSSTTSVTSSENVCMQNMVSKPIFCSSSESAIDVLDSALISSPSAVHEQVKSTENNSDASQISLSSSIIDPKLLILKKGEALLKQPSMLALVSRNQSPHGTCSDYLDRVSVECLSEYDLTTDVAAEKAVPAHLSFHVLNAPCNVADPTSKEESEKQALIQSEHCLAFEKLIPQDEPLLNSASSTQTQTHNSPKLPSSSGSVCSTITDQSEGPINQPCQDSMLLEVEEQPSPVQHLAEIKDAQDNTMEQLDASIGESSEGEADGSSEAQTNESTVIPNPAQDKVRQWIAGRGTSSSTPSTSRTPSPPPASSSVECKTAQPSPQISGGVSQSDQTLSQRPRSDKHTDMAELAKHEAEIEHRTLSLKREGFWSLKRLSRVPEPLRTKVHWDYLCEEMQWLSADFAQERRWKRGVARKVVRMVMRHHEELRQKEERAKREEHAKLRRIAASIAKEVRSFWSSVEKVVQYKQQSRLEEKRKKALDLQLDFIVGQTERYSDLLSQSLQATPAAPTSVPSQRGHLNTTEEDDIDFEPPCEEEDDEETIEVEEQQEGNDAESQRKEIELLKQESTLPLDQLLSTLAVPEGPISEEEASDESSSTVEDEDKEFSANEEDAEDVEDTIEAQEVIEGDGDHVEELDDLAKEGEMSLDELLEKYKGAYASDFEEPSASPVFSEGSEGTEDEDEEETEGDESDDASLDSAENSDEEDDAEAKESDEENEDDAGEGMEVLLREGDHSPSVPTSPRPKKEISHIAATAESLQPKGYTLATTSVKTPIPFLLHGNLREYQHIGLDWLVTMYEKKLNGILADEMGLGKTIQTIALLAHLACEKGNWGPHLIIVPTSVMLNWEMELKRWCPGFKILTYYGSQKERKLKRQGWTKPNAFHVCITSYKLVLQDHQAFRRKSWKYLILDEAQNIKNFKSQRWQSLLNFNSHRRLLLTGTPLQNSLMELWSLMHFLMPHVFQSHREFKEWFSNPLTGMIEGSQEYNEGLVKRLHKVLRPFLLRRIKADVEKQMPKKYEHVVRCRLSKRQRFLYDDFMAQASTRETLASGHFMSVINILMQLRKVCNHPNLFDPRPIQSPFITENITYSTASLVLKALEKSPFERCDLSMFDLVSLEGRVSRYQADVYLPQRKVTRQLIQEIMESPEPPPRPKPIRMKVNRMLQPLPKSDGRSASTLNNPRPTCPVSPAVQPLRPPQITEVTHTQALVQPTPQVSTVTAVAAPPAPVSQGFTPTGSANSVMSIRHATPSTAPTVSVTPQPTSNVMTQRVLLSPDMQARLPSGEVVSIAQLASLAGRPVSSSQGSKPVTFQLQGNKLTLSGAPLQVPVAQPRSIQGNVMHLVSSGGQHHLISQPAQVAVLHTLSQSGSISANSNPTSTIPTCSGLAVPFTAAQVPSTRVSGPGIVKIVVRQAAGKEVGQVPTLAVPPSPRVAAPQSVLLHPHGTPSAAFRPPIAQQPSQRLPVHLVPPQVPTTSPCQPQPSCSVVKVVEGTSPGTGLAKANASLGGEESSSDVLAHKPMSSSQSHAFGLQRPRIQPPPPPPPRTPFYMSWLADRHKAQRDDQISQIFRNNELLCNAKPVFGQEVLDFLTFLSGSSPNPTRPTLNRWSHSGYSSCLIAQSQHNRDYLDQSKALRQAIHSSQERLCLISEVIDRFTFVIPPVEARPITMHCCHPPPSLSYQQALFSSTISANFSPLMHMLHRIHCNMRTHFPDLRLIQYDCGKLQTLHILLRKLKSEGHRVLIFTQMTRMLDVLEQFLNYHGHIYLRLDGSTRVEQRQALMERFNADRRIFCFILSTRSGGVGVNLTGADTVVFYDSDWNPTMDAQAQDRCHRIGQTRDVHIYRLISERTVEENILKKANQKRMLGDMAIEGGNFTTAFFKEQTIRELFDVYEGEKKEAETSVPPSDDEEGINKQQTTILEQALCRAEDEEDIVAASQAKAEQVAELAEFNENIPLDDGESRDQEEEELSKAEQEIAALVEQLTPIERYAMNFLEASLEDICKEELKQAEEQVEAARKGLDQAKEEGLKLHQSSDNDDDDSMPHTPEEHPPARRTRRQREKGAPSTRVSGRLRGTPAKMDDDGSTTHPSPDRERGRRGETSLNRAAGPSSSLKSSQLKEVPEKIRSGVRGRSGNEDVACSTSTVGGPLKLQIDQQLSDSERSNMLSQYHQSLSPVPSDATSSSVDRNASGHTSTLTILFRDTGDEHGPETDTNTPQQIIKERRASVSSESVCSPEHQSEQDGQHSLFPSLTSPHSRSPRKRQSADEEVLKGLPEDSPSAKVLRKLPGRLVTVVEDKEPKRRKRGECGSGGIHTEGSSEEIEHPESLQDSIHLSPSQSINDKALQKSPSTSPSEARQGQEQASPSSLVNPGRGYHPYSPTHHSPDMPVLRNLPVRRRLETESRMAAQLGEQCRGRGLDRRTPLSPKKQEPISSKDGSTTPTAASEANAACLSQGKRKRGRPPKMSPKPSEPQEQDISVAQKSINEERSPPQSPKRKRGRPRKDSTTNTVESVKLEKESSSSTSLLSISQESISAVNVISNGSNFGPLVPSVPECPTMNSEVDGDSESFKTADPPQFPKTDTRDIQFSTPPPHASSESQSNQTSILELPSEHTNLKDAALNSVSSDLSLSAIPHVIQTENAIQTNTKPSSPSATTPSDSFDSATSNPAKECIIPSASSVCQSTQVTTSPSQLSNKSNQCTDLTQVSTASTELLAQPVLKSNVSSPPLTSDSVKSTAFTQTFELLSESTVTTGLQPLSVPDSAQPSVQSDMPLETPLNQNQTNTALSQSQPDLTQTVTTHLSQIPLAPMSFPESLEMASDTSQQSPESRQRNVHIPVHAEEQITSNQPSVSTEDGLSTVEKEIDINEKLGKAERDDSQCQAKKRKLDNLPEDQRSDEPLTAETMMQNTLGNVTDALPDEENKTKDQESKSTGKKKNICRQSSQESIRSSSPSSVSSSGTLSSRSKNSTESRMPAKRKRIERGSEKDSTDRGSDQEPVKPESRCSNSASSDSEDSTGKERRLTRSSHKRLEKVIMSEEGEKSSNGRRRSKKKVTKDVEATAATPIRLTRKSIGTQPSPKLTSSISAEPEVLGKRCSALNAAAKLLAMRGKGPDPPSSSSKFKAIQGQQPTFDKITKSKVKQDQDSPKSNSIVNKTESSVQTPASSTDSPRHATETGHSASRSTRQRPGHLVPPLDTEVKRAKKEEKKKTSDKKEDVEIENRETRSSRGHSACSSVSSERGADSSRSRSSSNSSQCTRSLSSRSTGPPYSHSRAPSSGSDTEKGKGRQKKTAENRGRESRRERHSKNHGKPEPSVGSSEGTPDRVLRSVAALAAAQARTPASNTRSSSSQQRHSKT
ncbi:helicase SRCAP isoform X2 [Silurus asotus]|uniref:Helicase SRCAP isoform X2 n=1 Tax=Silurus asotus TaxID=30991 RepID=A0AAD5AUT3_SILAS|nr:helicase SRCAP isoform X2 [Silurus asotus]